MIGRLIDLIRREFTIHSPSEEWRDAYIVAGLHAENRRLEAERDEAVRIASQIAEDLRLIVGGEASACSFCRYSEASQMAFCGTCWVCGNGINNNFEWRDHRENGDHQN